VPDRAQLFNGVIVAVVEPEGLRHRYERIAARDATGWIIGEHNRPLRLPRTPSLSAS